MDIKEIVKYLIKILSHFNISKVYTSIRLHLLKLHLELFLNLGVGYINEQSMPEGAILQLHFCLFFPRTYRKTKNSNQSLHLQWVLW